MTILKHTNSNLKEMEMQNAACFIKNGVLTLTGCLTQVSHYCLLVWIPSDLCIIIVYITLLENPLPLSDPYFIKPFFDPEVVHKLSSTTKKISAYLDRAGAEKWWKELLTFASRYTEVVEPQYVEGNECYNVSEYVSDYHFTDAWILPTLKILSPKDSQVIQNSIGDSSGGSDVSGIVLESPQKTLISDKEFPCNISGIGDLCTSWIGKTGILEIQNKIAEQNNRQGKNTSRQLRTLATECFKAFEVLDGQKSADPQVKKAIALCMEHAPAVPKQAIPTSTCTISSLWNAPRHREISSGETPQSMATVVLGENLVSTITEKKRTAPDVSLHVQCLFPGMFPALLFIHRLIVTSQLLQDVSVASWDSWLYSFGVGNIPA